MKVTKKDNKELFEEVDFARRGIIRNGPRNYLEVDDTRLLSTNGHVLYLSHCKGIETGFYGVKRINGPAFALEEVEVQFSPVDDFLASMSFVCRTVIERNILRVRLRQVAILADRRYSTCRLYFRGDRLAFELINPNEGTVNADVELKTALTIPQEIGINVRYLLSAVQAFKAGEIEAQLQESPEKNALKLTDGKREVYIMPCRL